MDKQILSTFMEVTSCESEAYAVQHLGSCRWNIDEAINLYFTGGGGGGPILSEEQVVMEDDDIGVRGDNDNVRAPIPARVEALYDNDAYYDYHTYGVSSFGDLTSYQTSPPVPVEATGWGEADLGNATTGSEEATPGYAGQIGSENLVGGEAHNDMEHEENINGENDDNTSSNSEEDNVQSDDDNMSYISDNDEMEDYGFEMDEDSYYASIEDEDSTDAPTMQRQQQNSLEDLYAPPLDLMYNGRFHDAKVHAARQDQFLLVNLQTRGGAGDFPSMLQNRDLWSDELVKNVVKDSFVFLLLKKKSTDDYSNDVRHLECSKVCSFYRLENDQLPAVLVLDPITGQLLAKRSGPMTPDEFVKYVDEYMKSKPSTMCMLKFVRKTPAIATAVEHEPAAPEISAPAAEASEKAPEIPDSSAPTGEPVAAPEVEMVDKDDEPMEGEKMYKLRIRFPDGNMIAKEFGCKRKVASLFAFCRSAVNGGGEAKQKAFRIMRFAGGCFQAVQGDGGVTFEELDLNYTTVSVVFDN